VKGEGPFWLVLLIGFVLVLIVIVASGALEGALQ
jgi:hypothetical protein